MSAFVRGDTFFLPSIMQLVLVLAFVISSLNSHEVGGATHQSCSNTYTLSRGMTPLRGDGQEKTRYGREDRSSMRIIAIDFCLNRG